MWPYRPVDPEFRPFEVRKHKLSAQQDCLLCGSRVVIPAPLQFSVLATLHKGHPGIVRMKGLGHSLVPTWTKLSLNG